MKALEYFDKLLEMENPTKDESKQIQNRFYFAEGFSNEQNKELIEICNKLKESMIDKVCDSCGKVSTPIIDDEGIKICPKCESYWYDYKF